MGTRPTATAARAATWYGAARRGSIARRIGRRPSVAEVVAGVAARVALQVVLVLALGAVPRRRRLDGRRDRPRPRARRVHPRDHALGDRALLGRLREDRRAVLRPDVVPLAVARRRVVQLE